MARSHVICAILVLCCAAPAVANKRIINIASTDASREYLGTFGYCEGGDGWGAVNITLHNFEIACQGANGAVVPPSESCLAEIAIGLESQETLSQARNDGYNSPCDLSPRPGFIPLLGAVAQRRLDEAADGLAVLPVPWCDKNSCAIRVGAAAGISPKPGGFWTLVLRNCAAKNRPRARLSIEIREKNFIDGKRNYLSCGDMPRPWIMLAFFGVFVGLAIAWVWTCHENQAYVHKIHYLMGLLVVTKAGSLFFSATKAFDAASYGEHAVRSDVPYYIFMMIKGTLLFVVILLVGTGWSLLKPFLADKDKHVLVIVLPFQIGANIALIFLDESNEGTAFWTYWRNVLKTFDIICCVAILIPIVWSIRSLRDAAATDGKVARNLSRLKQFRTFYVVVVLYIYFTRIVVELVTAALHYRWTWVSPFLLECGALAFYVFVGVRFRPMYENPYLGLEDEDFDDVTLLRELEEENKPHEEVTVETTDDKGGIRKKQAKTGEEGA